jgi:von Willebrand factor type A domain
MKLRDEWLEFIHDRLPQWIARIFVPILVLVSIYALISNRSDILWVSIYIFIVTFVILNALYILLAQEKAPAIVAANKGAFGRVAKFSLLIPPARIALLLAILLMPLFGFVAPFSQPITVLLNGTPTFTPTITLTPTQTLTPTATATNTFTVTPSATVTPQKQGVYYMIVLDASSKMTEAFDGKTKWDVARDSINAILAGLEPGANYGLVTIGGTSSGEGVDPCNEPSNVRSPFAPRQNISDQIAQLQPLGGGSLSTAFSLANDQFAGLPENTVRVLIYITNSSDACASRNEWQELGKLFADNDKAGVKLHTEMIVLDQNLKPADQNTLKGINSLSKNVNLQIPQNISALPQVYATALSNIGVYINKTIASYPTSTPIVTPTLTVTFKPGTPTRVPTITLTPTVTQTTGAPTTALTWTPTVTPVTPSATPVQVTSVKLLNVTYLTQGIGCQIDVQVQVNGGPATGEFHVRNDSYAPGDSTAAPQTTLQVGTNYASTFGFTNQLTLSGDKPAYYQHEVWFEYNGVQSNHLKNVVCPGIPPPP